MRIKMMTPLKGVLASCLLLMTEPTMSADVDTADVDIEIIGEIFIPPCEINGDSQIEVDFGKMSLQAVDGSTYQQVVTVLVVCTYYTGTPYVMVTGTPLGGGPDNVLQTNATGVNASLLGVALYQGSGLTTKLVLGGGTSGVGYAVTKGLTNVGGANSSFTFTAVPYKSGTGTLEAGLFTATASMSIIYQ